MLRVYICWWQNILFLFHICFQEYVRLAAINLRSGLLLNSWIFRKQTTIKGDEACSVFAPLHYRFFLMSDVLTVWYFHKRMTYLDVPSWFVFNMFCRVCVIWHKFVSSSSALNLFTLRSTFNNFHWWRLEQIIQNYSSIVRWLICEVNIILPTSAKMH